MASFTRRRFIELGTGAMALAALPAQAAKLGVARDGPAVLVDTTRCIGCRTCEASCAEANGLPAPADTDFAERRMTGPTQFTVVNRAKSPGRDGNERYAKTQCLHCLEPACASACLVRALDKTPEGPVVYHADRCIGCRYCMVACPFGVPRFEFSKAVPLVRKCTFCAERQKAGKKPACVENCPAEALTFGRRDEMLLEAQRRVVGAPDRYVQHVYGDREAGGTSWLYITDVPFEELGLAEGVPDTSPVHATETALAAVPVVMTLWPPLLLGMRACTQPPEADRGPAGPATCEPEDARDSGTEDDHA